MSQERGSRWPQARRLGSPPTTCQPQTDWGERKAFQSSLVQILMLSLETREPSLGRLVPGTGPRCSGRQGPLRGSAPPASGPGPAAGSPGTLPPTTLPSSQHGWGVGFPTWHCHISRSHINHCSRTKMKSPGLPKWEQGKTVSLHPGSHGAPGSRSQQMCSPPYPPAAGGHPSPRPFPSPLLGGSLSTVYPFGDGPAMPCFLDSSGLKAEGAS